MSSFQSSSQNLRNAGTNASTIAGAISNNPLFALSGGDLGHAGLVSALTAFRSTWSTELRLRNRAATDASSLLSTAASDTERVDALLAQAAGRLGQP